MPHPSSTRLLVLHGLRVKGFAEASVLADLWRLGEDEVQAQLDALAGEGLVQRREGRVSGWSLTADGRSAHERAVAAEVEEAGVREAVDAAYRRFLAVNPELLGTCTAWQLRQVEDRQVVNDHADGAYDAGVVARLVALHEDALPIVTELVASLERFGRYPERLTDAVARVRAGDVEWFTKPLLDSYHTVWFELHEDLLSTLGLTRGSEVPGGVA